MARILLIDDDEPVRRTLKAVLEQGGHSVAVAGEGRSGLICFRQNTFELVITDILMPESEGIETISALSRAKPGIPIIAITGGAPIESIPGGRTLDYLAIARELGARATLRKPFTRRELLDVVESCLEPAC